MNSSIKPPIDAVLALAQQQFDEIVSIRTLDRLARGDRGDGAQAKRVEHLLSSLFAASARVKSEFQGRMRGQAVPTISLSPAHAEFLRSKLLPNMGVLEKAYFADDPLLIELLGTQNDVELRAAESSIRDAVWFTGDYTNIMLDDPDDRRHNVDTVFDLLDQPWFMPDLWDANLRSLRPIVLGLEESKVPQRIRVRLLEMHRSFVYGAWMATIALCRAVVEFALVERAPNIGYQVTQKSRSGAEEYLPLNKLIANAIAAKPGLENDLERLRGAGNRILHPKKKQNVIASPKVLREEAFQCVQSTTRVVEELYSRQHST